MPRFVARDDYPSQPQRVEETLRNYLGMTQPHYPRPDRPQPLIRPLDNEGLALEEGNDFA